MLTNEIRKQFLNFFEKRGHKIVPSSPLVPSDSSVLFTTAGMQQFKPYYLGEVSPFGNRVVSCQKCFRTSDIEEVGDKTHLTFLEMLGNFSFGDYFKKQAIEYAYQLLVSEFKIPQEKLWITIFKGDKEVPKDEESEKFWLELGISRERISYFGREDNFWGPTGKEGPCGPTTEIHFELHQEPCSLAKKCRPNCQCGRFMEIWNLVFNEYFSDEQGRISLLKQKGVDTGMGLERLAVVLQNKKHVFEIDSFQGIFEELDSFDIKNGHHEKWRRIIVDHIRGICFLIADGILPSNLDQGYILRRIIRRAVRYGFLLNLPKNFLIPLAQRVIEEQKSVYPELLQERSNILTVIQHETESFLSTLKKGVSQFEKMSRGKEELSGQEIFKLVTTYGLPLEMISDLSDERKIKLDIRGYQALFKKHQEISRAGAEKKFGGHNINQIRDPEEKEKIIKLHTATHLLHQALRDVLGSHVKQMGSDINSERLRFDFSHPEKMTSEQIKQVEEIVNKKIKEDLPVTYQEMSFDQALKSGALAFFKNKYGARVKVYSIGDYSKEVCAGPHVKRTGQLGRFKIIKEESSSAGVRRIKAVLE